jgi:serralysin
MAVTINLVAGTVSRSSGGRDVVTGGAVRGIFDHDHTSDGLPGSANRDVIIDFAYNSGKIDLAGIAADVTYAGNRAFVWLGDRPFSGASQVDFITSGGNTIVQASTDADSTPELQIRLTGTVALGEGDFLL